MKRTIKLTTEQMNLLMKEGVVYDVDNVKENPRLLSTAKQHDGSINLGSFNNGGDSEEPVNITTDVDNVADTAAEIKTQGINANIVTPANGADSGELAQAEADAKNAGAEQVNESKFTKKEIMEMRSKYLNENITSYAKKDFYNRRNGR